MAAAFLDGDWERRGMADRAVQAYRDPPYGRHRELVALIDRVLARRDAEGLLPRPPRRVPAADDLVFSGGSLLHAASARVRSLAGDVVRDEGFRLNRRKTALMTSAGRQRVCGVVVNVRPNLARADYDRLRAELHRAAIQGADAGQRARLLGRIA
jgi:hypothetical protein